MENKKPNRYGFNPKNLSREAMKEEFFSFRLATLISTGIGLLIIFYLMNFSHGGEYPVWWLAIVHWFETNFHLSTNIFCQSVRFSELMPSICTVRVILFLIGFSAGATLSAQAIDRWVYRDWYQNESIQAAVKQGKKYRHFVPEVFITLLALLMIFSGFLISDTPHRHVHDASFDGFLDGTQVGILSMTLSFPGLGFMVGRYLSFLRLFFIRKLTN